MTEEYKKNLIDYFTNKLTNTPSSSSEIIEETIEVNRQDWVNFIPSSWSDFKYEGLISPNENTSGLYILYGGYYVNNDKTNGKGIITLLDTDFKPVKTFYQYDNGTTLRYIQHMNQAEDGTFYMVDDTYWGHKYDDAAFANGTRRFVMLNNFSVKNGDQYNLILRTSYIFGVEYNNFYCRDIYKNPSSSHYVLLGKFFETYKNTKTISLKINVGASNEWGYINTNNYEYAGSFVEFNDDDNYYSRLILNQASALRNYFITGTKDYNDVSYTMNNTGTFNYYFDIDTQNYENQVVFINKNEVYFVGNNQVRQIGPDPYDKYIGLYYYNYSTSTLKTIFEEFIENANAINKRAMYICKNLNEIYLQYNNNFNSNTADYYYQRLTNNIWNPISLGNHNFVRNQRSIAVKNKFNLTTIYLYPNNPRSTTWYNLLIKEVYNPTQYNGQSYVDTNFASPLYANLYSNGSLVFSRNLYNVSKQNNMTTSSVEVPNNYLNGITINKNNLISKTNFKIVEDTTNWTKNIYEVVDVNFLNIINVIDEDKNKTYSLGAIKINNSITDGGTTNYNNTKCAKYRINYEDNTALVNIIMWRNINDLVKQTYFTIYVNKAIKSIDLISNDESTIYLTINGDFEIGNYYSINQKVRIGNKPLQAELQYNGENVLYNNNQVMVYTQGE